MENKKTIRWQQRFRNMQKALMLLTEAVERNNLNRLEQEGLVQRFEYSFELAWKVLKDYLESKGVLAPFPRDVLKEAFSAGILSEGELWLEMLEGRNRLAHTYNEETFLFAVDKIKNHYYPEIIALQQQLSGELESSGG